MIISVEQLSLSQKGIATMRSNKDKNSASIFTKLKDKSETWKLCPWKKTIMELLLPSNKHEQFILQATDMYPKKY